MGNVLVNDKATFRRFTLGDAMILIAAIAVGVAGFRTYRYSIDTITKSPAARTSLSRARISYIWPILASMTLAVPVLRWSQSRGRYRRLSRRPGFAACHAAAVGILFAFGTSAYDMARSVDPERLPLYLCIMVHRFPQFSAPAVAAVWATMWINGQWHSEPDWIGRLGGLVGIGWIVGFLLLEFQFWN